MRLLIKYLRKILVASFFIYGFNLISQSIDLIIPLNIYTIFYTSLFGITGFISILTIYFIGFK